MSPQSKNSVQIYYIFLVIFQSSHSLLTSWVLMPYLFHQLHNLHNKRIPEKKNRSVINNVILREY